MNRGNITRRALNPIIAAIGLMSLAAVVLRPTVLAGPEGLTRNWSFTGDLNTARVLHNATLLPNGEVLVVGGSDDNGTLKSAELYDPASGTWSFTGNLNTAR